MNVSTLPTIPESFAGGPAAVVVERGVIRASGSDTETYLQGQLSQDLTPLAPGQSAWSLLLQPQGKVDAWLRISRIDHETFLLDVDAAALDTTLARLNRFKLRTACEFEGAVWSVVSVRGAGASDLDIPVGSGAEVVVAAEWPGIDGLDLLGEDVAIPDGVAVATAADLDLLRILCGVPAMGAELTENTIPAEAGIVDRSASFTKGCYTGQELVARIDSRGGNVPKHLRGLFGHGPLAVGAAVLVDGTEVGTITSTAGPVALAYIKRAVDTFPAAAEVAGEAAEIHILPLI